MSTEQTNQQRIHELEQLAAEEGITLPWPASVIAGIEDRGGYVDLLTGMVGSAAERVELTVIGEAVIVARWVS